MFIKTISNRENPKNEIELQTIVSTRYDFCPKILGVREDDMFTYVSMEYIEGYTLSDYYSDQPCDIPEWAWNEMRRIITLLYEDEGIEYRDISPYNFMISDDKLYIIDFGDAKYSDGEINWFLREFLDGENSWNPDYK